MSMQINEDTSSAHDKLELIRKLSSKNGRTGKRLKVYIGMPRIWTFNRPASLYYDAEQQSFMVQQRGTYSSRGFRKRYYSMKVFADGQIQHDTAGNRWRFPPS